MTAPDPRLEEIEAKLRAAESYGYPSFMLATAHVAYLLAELRKAQDKLARVEVLHQRVEGYIFGAIPGAEPDWPVCSICFTDDERPHAWPCPTMAAVADATGGGDS